ncbi:hypothetical protein [Bacillus thuringiensis]|uniref:hypothetical protein n=1 Tax=Bacillus thuringiensis TaxID=1428 RepID=UPI000BFE6F21|nr:hypothetical protein [Bacillus thuringiensis]PGK38676.1 hypothetical protein CN908_17065 [Bacillus thuringiensis]
MIKNKKGNKIFIAILIVLFSAIFCSFSLLLLFINKGIVLDEKHINLLDMFIKSSFTLIGSTLSGVMALFIFSLQEKSKRREKEEKEIKYYGYIKSEFQTNFEILERILETINELGIQGLSKGVVDGKDVKEMLLVSQTRLSFTFYTDYLDELERHKYEHAIRAFKLSYEVYKYLDIINKIDNQQNIEAILRIIKRNIQEIRDLNNIIRQKELSL